MIKELWHQYKNIKLKKRHKILKSYKNIKKTFLEHDQH